MKISNKEDLIDVVAQGIRVKYLLFWGHKKLVSGIPKKPALWQGLNLLGFALMEVRDRLPSVA